MLRADLQKEKAHGGRVSVGMGGRVQGGRYVLGALMFPLHSLKKKKKKKAVCSTALSYVPEVLYIPE